MAFGVDGAHSDRWSPSSSGHGQREGTRRVLEVLEGRVVFAEDLLEVSEGAFSNLLVAGALAVEVSDDDDLRFVGHRDIGVGLLRALRWTFQDLQLEPERWVHPHLPDLFGLALRPGDLGSDLHRASLLLPDLLAHDRLMLMALRILEILSNLVNRGVEHAVVSHVYHSFLLRDMDDVPGGLYFVYYLKAVGKDSISRDPDVRFSPTARMRLCA